MDNLPCGMYRIRSLKRIQRIRKPKLTENTYTRSLSQILDHASYMEMIPGSSEEDFSLKSEYRCTYFCHYQFAYLISKV